MLLDNYPLDRGISCQTSAIQNVLKYYNVSLSEECIFGISSSLNFAYILPENAKELSYIPGINGSSFYTFENFATNFICDVKEYSYNDNFIAQDVVIDILRQKKPVILRVLLLTYIDKLSTKKNDFVNKSMETFKKQIIPNGNHITQLIGWDFETDEAFVFENNMSGVQRLAAADLREARNPNMICNSNPYNRYLLIEPITDKSYTKRAIINGLNATIEQYLYNTHKVCGLRSLRTLVDEISSWGDILSQEQMEATFIMFYYMCEKISGGGLYRRIYGRFMKEAAQLFKNQLLSDISDEYMELFRSWRKIANIMIHNLGKEIKVIKDKSFINLLNNIYKGEEKALFMMEKAVKDIGGDWCA